MGKINVLSKHISELIAAGEVVENPASALKELLENSIDSGATKITVKIKSGGIKEIQVTDNGSGIESDDIKNAFLKNATSKIKNEDDLEKISTLGFRGEALASICAVSKVEVVTKTKNEMYGTHYKINGGEELLLEEGSCPNGTTIIVKDIFYNTPARMKFLKTIAAESSAITKVIERVSISHPDISFKFIKDKNEEIKTTGDGTLESAVYSVYGKNFLDSLMTIDYEMDLLKVFGYISRIGCYGASRNMQIFFVNKRYVKSNVIRVALEQAFKGNIVSGKFPFCILFLEIPLDFVDVNVHPAKTQVRFGDEKLIYSLVYNAVQDRLYSLNKKEFPKFKSKENLTLKDVSLEKSDLKIDKMKSNIQKTNAWSKIVKAVNKGTLGTKKGNCNGEGNLSFDSPDYFSKYEISKNSISSDFKERNVNSPITYDTLSTGIEGKEKLTNEEIDYAKENLKTNETLKYDTFSPFLEYEISKESGNEPDARRISRQDQNEVTGFDIGKSKDTNSKDLSYVKKDLNTQENKIIKDTDKVLNKNEEIFNKKEDEPSLEILKINISKSLVGEIFKTYVILELSDSELLIIDKHAAHERLIYEKLKKQKVNENDSQILLEPISLTLSEDEYNIALNNKDVFLKFGFEIENFGQCMILIRSAPLYVDKKDIKLTVLDLIGNLFEDRNYIDNEKLEKIYKSMACRAAIKANDITKKEELISLVQKMKENNIKYCPHGRPVYIIIKKSDIEKKFFRK